MGPRSHERGNRIVAARLGRGRVVRLQWGRVLTNAETRDVAVCQKAQRPASMGPRSHERGNAGISTPYASTSRLASMGPRSHERGNGCSCEIGLQAKRCFNGAAFSRTRKRLRRMWRDAHQASFNGAAFSRTRKRALLSSTCAPTDVSLQWGRVLTNAETS